MNDLGTYNLVLILTRHTHGVGARGNAAGRGRARAGVGGVNARGCCGDSEPSWCVRAFLRVLKRPLATLPLCSAAESRQLPTYLLGGAADRGAAIFLLTFRDIPPAPRLPLLHSLAALLGKAQAAPPRPARLAQAATTARC